jgi:type II secretory pathway pseudopilin PulG
MQRTGQHGFSLVEVVIALGLLAGVLIAIGGLFIIGGRQVKSGRTSSEALAAAKEIQEEMAGWGFAQLWSNFGYNGAATTYTVDCRSNTANNLCPTWENTIRTKLGTTAYATLKIDSVTPATGSAPNFFDTSTNNILARNVRVTVTVNWTEVNGRNRSTQVVTTRN